VGLGAGEEIDGGQGWWVGAGRQWGLAAGEQRTSCGQLLTNGLASIRLVGSRLEQLVVGRASWLGPDDDGASDVSWAWKAKKLLVRERGGPGGQGMVLEGGSMGVRWNQRRGGGG